MEEISIKVNIPKEFKEEFELALNKVVKQFVRNLEFSIVNEISGISKDDNRKIKESVVKDVVKSIEQASKELKSGKKKPMNLDELDKIIGLK